MACAVRLRCTQGISSSVLHKTGVSVSGGPSENVGFTSSCVVHEADDVLVDFPQAWGKIWALFTLRFAFSL